MLTIIYRISDTGYNKVKPAYVSNETCLKNALKTISPYHHGEEVTWLFVADNISDETNAMIQRMMSPTTYQWEILKISVGSGAASFNEALNRALLYHDNDIIYFLENDYIHRLNWSMILLEGVRQIGADYVSLYDHPDKYIPAIRGGNPEIGSDKGEATKVFLSWSSHWKLTNSTTMTFAAKVSTLKRDEAILRKWTNIDDYPRDFDMFIELRDAGHSLITPIPSVATHGETAWLAPRIDWGSFI